MFFFFNGRMKTYKVAETYIRFKIEPTKANKEKLIQTLNKEAELYSKEFLKGQIKIIIVVEEGSLKGWVKVYGTTFLLGVATYGGFRDGLDRLISDSQNFSSAVIEHTQQDDNSYRTNFERAERRLGLPGRLKRTLDRINHLEENLDNIPQREIRSELNNLKQDLSNILNALEEQEQATLLQTLSPDLRNSLPEPDDRGVQQIINRYGIKDEEIRLRNEGE